MDPAMFGEAALVDRVAHAAREAGWEVEAEFHVGGEGGGRADLVLRRPTELVVVEAKVRIGGPVALERSRLQILGYLREMPAEAVGFLVVGSMSERVALHYLSRTRGRPKRIGLRSFHAFLPLLTDCVPLRPSGPRTRSTGRHARPRPTASQGGPFRAPVRDAVAAPVEDRWEDAVGSHPLLAQRDAVG